MDFLGPGGGFGGMWLGPIFWIFIFGLGVWLVGSLLRRNDGVQPPRAEKTPREILDERFARGEIDEDEYKRRRGLLEQ